MKLRRSNPGSVSGSSVGGANDSSQFSVEESNTNNSEDLTLATQNGAAAAPATPPPRGRSGILGGRRHRSLSGARRSMNQATPPKQQQQPESRTPQRRGNSLRRAASRDSRRTLQRQSTSESGGSAYSSSGNPTRRKKSRDTTTSRTRLPPSQNKPINRRRRWSLTSGHGHTPQKGSHPAEEEDTQPASCPTGKPGLPPRRNPLHIASSTLSTRTLQTAASTESSLSPSSEKDGSTPRNIGTSRNHSDTRVISQMAAAQANYELKASNSSPCLSAIEESQSQPPAELDLPGMVPSDAALPEQQADHSTEIVLEEEPQVAVIREEEASMQRFQQMLERDDLTTIEQINLLYALGRLSAKMGRFEQALEYHQAELELTQDLVEETTRQGTVGAVVVANEGEEAARENDAVARVLDGMARIAKQGLGNAEAALEYHRAALQIRRNLQLRILEEAKHCEQCQSCGGNSSSSGPPRTPQRGVGRRPSHQNALLLQQLRPPPQSTTPLCPLHRRGLQDTVRAMEETKQHMGRILFEQGQVNRAVQLITKIAPPTTMPLRSNSAVS